MAPQLCKCSCHASTTIPFPLVGFDPLIDSDVVEAAVACSRCSGAHARIFDRPTRPYKPLLLPYSTDHDGDGAES